MGKNTGEKERDRPPVVDFFKEIYAIWIAERPTQLAAALAYFGLFSFAPVIYIAFSIAGIFLDQAALMENFMTRLEAALGPGVTQVDPGYAGKSYPEKHWGDIPGFPGQFFLPAAGSLGRFFSNPVRSEYGMESPHARPGSHAADGAPALVFVLDGDCHWTAAGSGSRSQCFGELVKLHLYSVWFPTFLHRAWLFCFSDVSFGLLYKLLPDVKVAWRDVWVGAVAAASLVTLGGWLILFFMSRTSLSSALEAAGTFVILLTGFYYFAQIFLLGAIITRLYAQHYGSMRPSPAEQSPV